MQSWSDKNNCEWLSLVWLGLLMAGLLTACGGETAGPNVTSVASGSTTASLSPNLTQTTSALSPANSTSAIAVQPTVGSVPTNAPLPLASPTAPLVLPTATSAPTSLPPSATAIPPTAVPTATPLPADLPPRAILALRARSYDGGEIKPDRLYEQTATHTAQLIYYTSDGLRISGLMMTPNGPKDKKYPVALINHGYFNPPEYDSGWDTLRELRFFADNGYITIASDYRNYARSDKGDNDRTPGYTIDILNLIEAAKKLPQADPSKITIMGHSMGGEITLNVLVVNRDVRVAALFGSMSPDAADNFYARIKWRGGDTPEKQIYGDPAQHPDLFRLMSPLTYFDDIKAPVIIHSGTNDTTTPPAWSEKIFSSLQKLNKPSQLYNYPGEGHSLNGAAFNTAMSRTLTFFNQALGLK